jgi:hypothetical protein
LSIWVPAALPPASHYPAREPSVNRTSNIQCPAERGDAAAVLHAAGPLGEALGQVAQDAGNTDRSAEDDHLEGVEASPAAADGQGHADAHQDGARQTLDRLVRADDGHQFVPPERGPDGVGPDVAALDHAGRQRQVQEAVKRFPRQKPYLGQEHAQEADRQDHQDRPADAGQGTRHVGLLLLYAPDLRHERGEDQGHDHQKVEFQPASVKPRQDAPGPVNFHPGGEDDQRRKRQRDARPAGVALQAQHPEELPRADPEARQE